MTIIDDSNNLINKIRGSLFEKQRDFRDVFISNANQIQDDNSKLVSEVLKLHIDIQEYNYIIEFMGLQKDIIYSHDLSLETASLSYNKSNKW